jgi:hypothetical protein
VLRRQLLALSSYFYRNLSSNVRKIQVDLILERELRNLIPNKQRKVKCRVSMEPLPTLNSLKAQVDHAFPALAKISYGMRFVVPRKVWRRSVLTNTDLSL